MIKGTLKNAIRSLAKRYKVGEREIRIKVYKGLDERGKRCIRCGIMKNSDDLDDINVATALNLMTIIAYQVENKLNEIIDSLSSEYKIPENELNVRIYTKTDDCEPLLYLFDKTKAEKPLDINNFI